MPLQSLAKFLVTGGVLLVILGIVVGIAARFFPRGLPGDIAVQRGNASFYFPIVSCIILSVVATIVLNIITRLFNR